MNHQTFQEILQDAQSDPSLQSTLNIRDLLEISGLQASTVENVFNGLNALNLDPDTMMDYCTKLFDYSMIEEFHELIVGRYIRWIRRVPTLRSLRSLRPDPDSPSPLNRGGILVKIMFKDDGIILQIKPCNTPFAIKLKYDNFVIFQKHTADQPLLT